MTLLSGVDRKIWNVLDIWDDINSSGFVKTVSQHYYQANACGNLKGSEPILAAGHHPRTPKAVRGNWYGLVFVADFMGSSGDFQIDPLNNATNPSLVGCAGYNAGKLTKFAVLDMHFWNGTGRPASHVELANLDAEITRARVSRLTAPGGSGNLENISWAGKQWSAADNDGQEPKESNFAVVKAIKGSLTVSISASQVIAGDDQRANT
ncbi:hypothetical protein C8J57DRAFT_1519410 [Mycena rebaudengoi]|nr:hypothetical protein C8J57DRAFT_1519410 [Mycena rebaudengoi]